MFCQVGFQFFVDFPRDQNTVVSLRGRQGDFPRGYTVVSLRVFLFSLDVVVSLCYATLSSRLSSLGRFVMLDQEGKFECLTYSAGLDEFGGDMDRFVEFHADNVLVLLNVLSCGEFPPFEVVDRVLTLASCLRDLYSVDTKCYDGMKQLLAKHGFSEIGFSKDVNDHIMFIGLHPDEDLGVCVTHVQVYISSGVGSSAVEKSGVTVRFSRELFEGYFSDHGFKLLRVRYMGGEPWFVVGENSAFEERSVNVDGEVVHTGDEF